MGTGRYDLVVVGAGIAGAAVVQRAGELGLSIAGEERSELDRFERELGAMPGGAPAVQRGRHTRAGPFPDARRPGCPSSAPRTKASRC